jgi:glycine dehydrogenase subunit 1
MAELAGHNANTDTHASFLGAGIYDHHIPSVILPLGIELPLECH